MRSLQAAVLRFCFRLSGLVLVALAAAIVLAIAPGARAACEVPLPGDPSAGEESCGAVDQDPPPATSGPGTGGVPNLIAWASGFDLSPFNGNNLGIWIARVDGTQRRKIASFSKSLDRDFSRLHGLNLPEDHPSFSPDSRKIVFTSNRAASENWDVYT
jgi:hypothetical protein